MHYGYLYHVIVYSIKQYDDGIAGIYDGKTFDFAK